MPKRRGNNNKDGDNSPQTLNDKYLLASSQKFVVHVINQRKEFLHCWPGELMTLMLMIISYRDEEQQMTKYQINDFKKNKETTALNWFHDDSNTNSSLWLRQKAHRKPMPWQPEVLSIDSGNSVNIYSFMPLKHFVNCISSQNSYFCLCLHVFF